MREVLHEEEAHHGVKVRKDGAVRANALLLRLRLRVRDLLSASIRFIVLGKVASMGGQEILVQWDRVLDKLDDARVGGQGNGPCMFECPDCVAEGRGGLSRGRRLVQTLVP